MLSSAASTLSLQLSNQINQISSGGTQFTDLSIFIHEQEVLCFVNHFTHIYEGLAYPLQRRQCKPHSANIYLKQQDAKLVQPAVDTHHL